jgi:hypothetical protein
MDCIDCHNRPSHRFHSPNRALDVALYIGAIDSSIPSIKLNAARVLLDDYATEPEALGKIAAGLRADYPGGGPGIDTAVGAVQEIYKKNFFPEMGVRWDVYPHDTGHMISSGCFRCHDDEHVSETGKRLTKDCNLCHTIIAQGPGTQPEAIASAGLEFIHPWGEDDDTWQFMRCDVCHSGAPEL